MSVYRDLHTLSEDERIETIGKAAMTGRRVAVLLEKDEPEKIARYIAKLAERFPGVMLLATHDGPTPLVVNLRFGLRQ